MQPTVEKSKAFQDLCESFGLDHNEIPEILTFDDACKLKGINPIILPDVSMISEHLQKPIIAQYKLMIIAQALNEGWTPNWSDRFQPKYYPWFEASSSGGGFSCCAYGLWYTDTFVGSRLCYKSRDIAIFIGKHFIDLYNDLFTI